MAISLVQDRTSIVKLEDAIKRYTKAAQHYKLVGMLLIDIFPETASINQFKLQYNAKNE